jgi:Reverse transcriptase (RNA-dependent DNA polymerase)
VVSVTICCFYCQTSGILVSFVAARVNCTESTEGTVAPIAPVPKISKPLTCADRSISVIPRPISVIPILSRVLDKIVRRKILCPAVVDPVLAKDLKDQFASRPTGSTSATAALINLPYVIAVMLQSCPYTHVIALDFSKAFDTVRHSTLMEKLAALPLPDYGYNWLVSYFCNR